MLSGDNGVLQRATDAKTNTDNAQIRERIQLAYHSALTKDITGENGELTKKTLQEELDNEFKDKTATITPNEDNTQWVIKVDEVEVTVTAGKDIPQVATLPSAEGTKPYFPSDSFSQVDGTDLTTGLVITDEVDEDGKSIGNEYVWIEVPNKNITGERTISFSGPDYSNTLPEKIEGILTDAQRTEIKGKLLAYTETLLPATGSNYKTTKRGWIDEYYDGCGIESSTAYNTLYDNMLKSVYNHGGFWIGRYEAGIDGSGTNISLARQPNSSRISSSSPKAVSKIDQIPYSWVYCREAQQLANNIDNIDTSFISSLMFGVQWDCVLKYLKETNAVDVAGLTSNSENWGNYNLVYDLSQSTAHGYKGEYVPFSGDLTITWSAIESGYSHPEMFYRGTMNDSVVGLYVLSTGATTRNMKRNIYDLAGNISEWTLEHATSVSGKECAGRGGDFSSAQTDIPASYRHYDYGSTTSGGYVRLPCLHILKFG